MSLESLLSGLVVERAGTLDGDEMANPLHSTTQLGKCRLVSILLKQTLLLKQ